MEVHWVRGEPEKPPFIPRQWRFIGSPPALHTHQVVRRSFHPASYDVSGTQWQEEDRKDVVSVHAWLPLSLSCVFGFAAVRSVNMPRRQWNNRNGCANNTDPHGDTSRFPARVRAALRTCGVCS